MASHHPIRKTVAPAPSVIPDKLYFRIGDVARLCEVPAYVLRFWETEFPNLKPNKGGTGQRLYRKRDVETALRIKHLLYDLGYTIPGARQVFKTEAKPADSPTLSIEASAESVASTLSPTSNPVILSEARSAQSKDPGALTLTADAAQRSNPRLLALREELRALHAQLSAHISTAETPKPLRPRLVAEPKPKPRIELEPKPKLGPVALPGQQALFPAE
jgi:DNA-binding transcriptional MerR regulator